ncbi:drug/metabolite transporter (DMT)-like permease [Pseudomonas sp. BIGb0408]|uniref:Drug/metabolite transporter (DMT)-like permease n=1 Tax=Phytopseudomonas flavescens TaxID=29435 RepID=A0A7Y9XIA2_9GAMM|nr:MULTISPECIES: DMT family transporter [Pseudomonas]MCW2293534.1 drug/metabolite transporter (DMT)-like permease [Pseudomonas sp. BIGb0408]NYH71895.1 drug/metabolite transporter (DMT)-like permease [Pseudomonas flavescens]
MNPLYSFYSRSLANGSLFAVLAAAGFSLKAIFVKLSYAAGSVDALGLLAMRMGLSLPLFLLLGWLSRREGRSALTVQDTLRVLWLGLVGYYLSSLFDFYGLEYISAGLERLILFTYPTLVLLFQMIALRERPTRRTLLASAICYAGLGVAFIHDIGTVGFSVEVIKGVAWVFASAVTYALYYLGAGLMVGRLGSMRLAALAGSTSAVMVLVHFSISSDAAALAELPVAIWGYAALMALLSTVLPIYWMALAIQRLGATQTAAIGNLGPLLTVLVSWAVLSEAISLYQLAGLALVLFGVSQLKSSQAAR